MLRSAIILSMKKTVPRGFTLVELIIVVAIIGALSMIGVPTYRRMVQKAKKSEAKVALGALYTAESAFFSEHGAYGTNLQAIGFEMKSIVNRASHSGRYHIGFPQFSDCRSALNWFRPWLTTISGQLINESFPDYYNLEKTIFVYWRLPNWDGYCLPADVPDDGSTFLATASGVIAPGIPLDTPDADLTDQWSINDFRELTNVHDGVQ